MQIHPYLNFGGRCEEALDFYKKTLDIRILSFSQENAPPKRWHAHAPTYVLS